MKHLLVMSMAAVASALTGAEIDGNEWQDQTRLSLGKEAPRAAFFTYPDEETARRSFWGEAKPWKTGDEVPFSAISLDYEADDASASPWRFKWSKDPASRPVGFQSPNYDISGWEGIVVPCSWQAINARGKFKGGWGRALYLCAGYPFAAHPPRVMDEPPKWYNTYAERNHVGCYRRDFDVPETWTQDRVFLKFDGVDSFYYLWVNGEYVGFTKDSRSPGEFEVTKFVKPGKNTVALEVYRYSDGSYFEDQDMFRLSGIFRHTWLLRRPAKRIRDFFVTAAPVKEGDFAGEWEMNVEVEGDGGGEGGRSGEGEGSGEVWTVSLFTLDGQPVLKKEIKNPTSSTSATPATSASCTLHLTSPKLWSAETPNCYSVVIGNGKEYASTLFGFRVSEIKNGRYYLNGQKIKLHGVNRHETDPGFGHYAPRSVMEKDLRLIKQANCNTVRNSHYPQDDYWYALCDLNGLYLVDEANMEYQGMGYSTNSLTHRPEWREATIQRSLNMIGRNKNHPSVIIWSYGNESGPGENFKAVGEAVRKADPTRPRHFEPDDDKADMDSVMYPSVDYVRKVANDTKRTRPFFICEYAHNMVNAMGNLKDYEDAIRSSDVIIGACIWDWVDQGLYKNVKCKMKNEKCEDEKCEERMIIGFGGDFGDQPNSGQFVMNGCVLADRTLEPGYWEIKHVYQPFTAALSADGKSIVLENRNYFRSGDYCSCEWTVTVNGLGLEVCRNGEKGVSGTFDISSLAPNSKITVPVPEAALKAQGPGKMVAVRVRFVQRETEGVIEKGSVVADDQIDLSAASPATTLVAEGEVKLVDGDKTFRFDTPAGTAYTFCRKTGALVSVCGKDGKEQLVRPLALDAMRCPSSNEIKPFNAALAEGLRDLEGVATEIGAVESLEGGAKAFTTVVEWRGRRRERQTGYGNVKAKIEDLGPTGATNTHFVVTTRWTVLGDGHLVCRNEIRSRGRDIELLRIGYRLALKGRDVKLDWFGNGPFENYADRKSGAFRSRWQRTLDELFVPYARNEDSGNMEGTTRLAVRTELGGLECTTLGAPFAFQASRWTPSDLIEHTHPAELPAPPAKAEIAILAATRGLGGDSCGPEPLKRDIIRARGVYKLDFVLGAPTDGDYTQFSFSEKPEGKRVFLGANPTVCGDGSLFAFEWNDRIWTASTTGGVAKCVTPGQWKCANPVLAADGRRIAFTSNREGNGNHVFEYDAADGSVRQISFHSEMTQPCAWTPDGSDLLVSVWRDHAARHGARLARLATKERRDIDVLFDAESFDPALSPDGKTLLFRRRGDNVYRKRLRSKETPEAGEIWSFNRETGAFAPLVTGRIDAREPAWAPDGKGFYYLYAEGGVRNVYYRSLDEKGKGVRLTDFTEDHVFQLSVSADGRTAVFRQLFDFWRLDLTKPGAKPVRIDLVPEAGAEARPDTRRRWYTTTWNNDEDGDAAFMPDGKTFAFTAGGDLYVMDSELREPKLVHGGSLTHVRGCVFSPGGTNLYYVSERGDGSDLWRVERADPKKAWWENTTFVKTHLVADGEIRRALSISPDGGSLAWRDYNGRLSFADTNGVVRVRGPQTSDPGAFAWSPDGRHVAAQIRGLNMQYEVTIVSTTEEGKVWPLTCNYLFDGNPTWSPDGKIIAWSSVRPDVAGGDLLCYVYLDAALEEYELLKSKRKALAPKDPPKPRLVPFEELRDRVRVTKVNASAPFFASDSRTIAFASGGVTKSVRLPDELNPKKVFDRTGRYRSWEKKDAKDSGKMFWLVGSKPAVGNDTYDISAYQTTDIADYQELMFRTAWGRFRDQYYDVNHHGVDWPAVRSKYLEAARRAGSPSVLGRVIRLLQGELDSSHLNYDFNDSASKEWERGPGSFHSWSAATRHLGIRFDPTHRGPGWKIRDVIPDSPVDRCGYGLKPGDVVTRVNGTEVSSGSDPTLVLNGPSDVKYSIVVDGREYQLDTISCWDARNLVGKAALKERRRLVHERSGNRLGYLNIEAMNNPSLTSFRQEVYSEGFGRDGLVIDVRENHGGFTADRMMMSLFCPKHNMWARRGNDIEYCLGYSENPLWYKPIVVLCSEETGSNAEIFSHGILQTKRGRLVGRQTGGAVIAIDTVSVLDYGTILMPRFGVFRLDGTDMEFNGARPDLEVDNRPDELAKGVDRQLETAIDALKEDVEAWKKAHPPVQPVYAR